MKEVKVLGAGCANCRNTQFRHFCSPNAVMT